ncbi:MAG: protein translocase SEC61 complex subunit gamma [Candidatus Aenigmarchaeota archaeon]|nr:protein translocase SEC61 complex subunit gamma [Candidatus Aenigmarchaeota archaeon]
MFRKIKDTLGNYKRVLIACSKPTMDEFKSYLKECVVGVLIIGFIGFLFYLVFSVLRI